MMRGLMPPWVGVDTFRSEMDRLFELLAELKGSESLPLKGWAPSMDLSETKDSLVCTVEVPGMEEKDLQISLQENRLTIKGEKRKEREDKDEHHHRVERAYGAFARTVRLPVAVDAGKVTATVKKGVLTITLPKISAASGTAVPIKAE
ncbi:MAG TPA: Hsp20/alpha crystallin family protein [Methylomirabilota bacterium]|nr:Hsp20/alpha crystallin family protein [Methylomirabilota bacterium]